MATDPRGQLFGGSALNPVDVGRIEIMLNYDYPVKYAVTAKLPIHEIVEGLNDCVQPVEGIEEKARGGIPVTLLLVARENGPHEPQGGAVHPTPGPIVLRLNVNQQLLAVGEPPLAPSPRLNRILQIILLRLENRDMPTDDTSLPGGFASIEVRWPDQAGDTEFALTILQAVTDFYSKAPFLTPAQKKDWQCAALHAPRVIGAEKYSHRVVAKVEDFVRKVKGDEERAPEYGGLPFGTMVQISAHDSLARFFEKTQRYEKAMAEISKLRDLLTDEVIQMATDAPSEEPDYIWNPDSLRRYLVWLKSTWCPLFLDRCKQKMSRDDK
jgi:hypothetical protein